MNRLKTALKSKKIIVSDGAMGTMLQRAGLPSGIAPEEWNRTQPDKVKNVSLQYFLAGSDMVLTNTFGGHPVKLGKFGLADEAEKLCRLGVELARKAADEAGKPDGIVAVSLGPTGEFMKPLGTLEPDEVKAGYAKAAKAAMDGGADAACIETFTAIDEAVIAVEAVAEIGLPVVATMSFDKGPAGYRTMMGVSPEEAAKKLKEAGAIAVGANCGSVEMADIPAIFKLMKKAVKIPFIVHANAGRPELRGNETVFPQSPEDIAISVPEVVKAGARIVGGCCGTTPEHIKSIRKAVDALRS
jgi:5-methyltetrahydrofolate--homocysteine methyltransferase